MAKNKNLIEQYKFVHQQAQRITPKIYASIALALCRKYGWEYEQINDLFGESQNIWNESINCNFDMLEMCEQETGIELRSE